MTDAQYLAWLQSSGAVRCVLVEAEARVGGVETTRYLSSANFITGAGDSPAHRAYLAVVRTGVTITEQINLDGSAGLTWGDIEIGNEDGSRDAWLGDIWANRAVRIYSGDARWPRADFRLIFDGTLAGISSRERGTLNLALRDKGQRLNTPITENRLGGVTENKDRLRPLCFGECHNVEPLLIDPTTLTFMVHDGPIERIIEVRDNGVPVSFTENLANGTFTLASQPAGLVTVSVQGDKDANGWRTRAASIIFRITNQFGKPADRFTGGDYDSANFNDFDNANTQPLGLYLSERTNVLQACAELASSVGAQVVLNGVGQLRMVKIQLPAPGVPVNAGPGQMIERTLVVSQRPQVAAAIKIGYCKNWTVQTNLQSGIPEQHKNLFALEWLTTTATNSGTASAYRLAVEPEQVDTLLLTEATAIAEAARRLALWSVQRTVYAFEGTAALMLVGLGDPMTLTSSRFGLDAGKPGQVISIRRDWIKCRTQFEVLT